MALLVEKYEILPDYPEELRFLTIPQDRVDRKAKLKEAIHSLFELDSFESF